jgi:hypothetical protein
MVKAGFYNEQLINILPSGATLRSADVNPANWFTLKPTNNTIAHDTGAVRFTSTRTTPVTFRFIRIDLSSITSGNRPHACFDFGGDPLVHLIVEDFECLGPATGMASHTAAALFGSSGGGVQTYRRGIIRNWISGMDHPTNNPGAHGIYQQGQNGLYEDLDIRNVNGRCFRTRNTSRSMNNTFRYIFCGDSKNASILDGPTSPSGNLAHNIVLWNASGIEVRDGSSVLHATIIGGASGRCARTRDTANVIRNSILLNCGGNAIINEGTNSIITDNITSGSINDFFIDPAKGDFRLKPGSSAINSGATISQIGRDFAGTPRPQGCCHDIGAFEHTTAVTNPPPPAPGNLHAVAQ